MAAILVLSTGARGRASERPRALTLSEAIELAIAQEPLVAEARVGKARTKLGVLRAQLDRVTIKVDGLLQELWQKTNIGGQAMCSVAGFSFAADPTRCASMGGTAASDSSGQGNFNVTAQVQVPLFTGFRVTANVKRAQLAEEAAGAAMRQARKDTALAVARAYWSVRRLDLRRAVQGAQLARLGESEAIVAARVRAGLAPQVDANRARLRRLQQAATLADLEGQTREALAQLAVSLGVASEVVLVDAPSLPSGPPPPVEELLAAAKKGRPEILTARLQREQQHQVVRMAQSSWYPQLAAFGALQFGNNPFQFSVGARTASITPNPFGNLAGNLTLGATLNINFFDTLNTWTSTKDAKYEESRLVEEERRFGRIVEGDVRMAHAKLFHYATMREPLTAAAEIARDNATIIASRYKNGEALVIEYLDAENSVGDVDSQLADLTAQLQVAWYELGAALGETVGATGGTNPAAAENP